MRSSIALRVMRVVNFKPKPSQQNDADHAAVNHRAANIFIDRTARGRKIAHHTADKRIACAGWIDDCVQRKRRANETIRRATKGSRRARLFSR